MGMKHEPIAEVWAASCKLRAEGSKRYAEADMLTPECDELNAKGSALYARAMSLYYHAVIKKYGDKAVINWATGEIEK
jgi:hypothetical protein